MSLAALAGLGVAAGLKAGFDQSANREAMATQQKYFKENQEQAYQNQRNLIRDASALEKSGMLAAGFSPTALAGATPAIPSVSSAPMGDALPTKMSTLAEIASLANVSNQTKVADAQSNLLNKQAEGQAIVNNREHEADLVFGDAYKSQLEEQIQIYEKLGLDSSKLRADYDALSENGANLGTFQANLKAIELNAKSLDSFTHKLESIVNQATEANKISNNVAKDIAAMPALERHLQEKMIALKAAERYYMLSAAAVNDSQKSLNQENLRKIPIEISKLREEVTLAKKQGKLTDAEANRIINSDVNTMIEDGRYMDALRTESIVAVEKGVQGFSQGFGAAAGAFTVARGGAALGGVTKLAGTAKAVKPVISSLERSLKGIRGLLQGKPAQLKKFEDMVKKLGAENAVKEFHRRLKH